MTFEFIIAMIFVAFIVWLNWGSIKQKKEDVKNE